MSYTFFGHNLDGPYPPNGSFTVYGTDKDGNQITSKKDYKEEWCLYPPDETWELTMKVDLKTYYTDIKDHIEDDLENWEKVKKTWNYTEVNLYHFVCGNVILELHGGMYPTPEEAIRSMEEAVETLNLPFPRKL